MLKRLTLLLTVVAVLANGANAADIYTDSTTVEGTKFYFTINDDGTTITIANESDTQSTSAPQSYSGSITIPDSLTDGSSIYKVSALGAYAFYGCTGLTSIDLSKCSSLTSLGIYCFRGCSALSDINLDCPSLTSIGNSCFRGCTSLDSVDFSACTSLTTTGTYCFQGCTELKSVDLSNCTSLTSLGNYFFQSCTGLTTVNLDGCTSLTSLGNYCFYSCSNLSNVDGLSNTALTSIGTSCFTYSGLKNIALPASLTSLPQDCFSYCSSLDSVDLSNCTALATIGTNCFYNCSSLKSIDLSQTSPTTVNNYLFYGCTSLTSVILPATLTRFGSRVFYNCTSLASVDLSACTGLTNIGDYCFYGCTSLTDIDLSNCTSLTAFGSSSFYGCTALEKIKCYSASVASLGSNALTNTPTSLKIYVLPYMVSGYAAAANWSTYASQLYPSYDVEVDESGSATLALPYTAVVPEGVTFYSLDTIGLSSSDAPYVLGTELSYSAGDVLAYDQPVYISATAGTYEFLGCYGSSDENYHLSEVGTTPTNGVLTGVYQETSASNISVEDGQTVYVLGDESGSFVALSSDAAVDGFSGYLVVDESLAGSDATISFTTEIEEEPAGTKHTFNIDNADNLYLLYNGSDTLDIVSGKNVFYVDYDSLGAASVYYRIQSKDDCFVTSVSYASDDDESIGGTGYVSSYKRCYLYLYGTYGDVTVDVTTANVDDRTNTLIVNVDSADIVSFKLYATSTQIELENGENTVKFADFENRMYVAHISPYSYSLYKVELNGVEQEISGYYYYIDVEDGDTLDITAIIPDMDVKFTITLPDGIDDFIESFEVNYEEIEPEVYLADDYTIKAGSYVYLYGNTTDYQVDSLLVNGTKKSFYSSYSATIMEDTELEFFLTKYGVDTVYITIDNPDAVTIYAGNYLELEEGRNLVEVSQNVSYISYYANDGYYVDSVVVDGVTQTRSYFYPENGMEIEFYTGIINRDQTYALYIDDATNVSYVYVGSTEYYDAGYYTCAFYDGDLPIYAYSSSYNVEPYVYLNDELQTGDVYNWSYIYAYYYFYTLVDGDVIKYYFAGEPSTYTATFTTVGDASAVTVTKDIIVAVSDWADGISALQGTQVNIAGDGILSVTVDEEALEATDGEYIFTIDADKAVVITMSETTDDGDDDEDGETDGITTISASSLGTGGDVYNAAGVLLIKDATTEQIASLARGLYIINGTKVVK